jgi:hypothetical protein
MTRLLSARGLDDAFRGRVGDACGASASAARPFRPLFLLVTFALATLATSCVGRSQRLAEAMAPGGPKPGKLVGCPGKPVPAVDGLIDDFEDGNNQVALMGERDGYWYTAADKLGSKVTSPSESFQPAEGGANGSAMAVRVAGHTVAAGDQAWGVEFGSNLLMAQDQFYDASRYVGISFRAKAAGKGIKTVRVNVTDVNTHPNGGVCTACYNHFRKDVNLTGEWKEYRVLFRELEQRPGWGSPRPEHVTPEKLVSVTFAVGGVDADFDVWVDDLQFLECKK